MNKKVTIYIPEWLEKYIRKMAEQEQRSFSGQAKRMLGLQAYEQLEKEE